MENENINKKVKEFIRGYTAMDINGVVIHCSYWMNKLQGGKVNLRGFANGKGSAKEIKEELIKRLNNLTSEIRFKLTPENLRKFTKRENIGIDCSGFVFRVLDELLRLGFRSTKYKNLDDVFDGGISKTNVKRFTSPQYSTEIKNIKDYKLGDMIRLWGGKHIAIIIEVKGKEIIYAHSSSLSTKIQGVHTSVIRIIDGDKALEDQAWEEKTRSGENFGEKRFNREKGDGVFRLKIFS